MSRTLPDKLVAVVTAPGEDLADWCLEARDRPLAEHEQAVLERGVETVHRHPEQAGAAPRAREDAAFARVEQTREAAEPPDRAPGALVAEVDGTMIRSLDSRHEARVGLVAGVVDGELTPALPGLRKRFRPARQVGGEARLGSKLDRSRPRLWYHLGDHAPRPATRPAVPPPSISRG